LKENKNYHEIRIDSCHDLIAIARGRWIHFVEVYELQEKIRQCDQAKNDGSKSNGQAAVALKKWAFLSTFPSLEIATNVINLIIFRVFLSLKSKSF
jgi:hypothetical protein